MTEVASGNNDLLSEMLIAKLLEEDMVILESARAAEDMQMKEALNSSSTLATGRFPKKQKSAATLSKGSDHSDTVLTTLAAEISVAKDALLAQSMQHAEDSNMAASRQYAQKLAASEKKSMLDAEFAKRLQQAIDDGEDIDTMGDAESVLGRDEIESIIASDINDKGKGKGSSTGTFRGKDVVSTGGIGIKKEESPSPNLHPMCGICMEPFHATYSPVAAARSANSSDRLQFGTTLPCPKSHGYCISCLTGYINSKLDPDGTGTGNPNTVVFPIRCPECLVTAWPEGISDDVASRVLSQKALTLWHHQKLLDTLPKYYCPNPRCSVLVQLDEDSDDPQATCPSCETVICVSCRVVWHEDMDCEEYQALPLDERSPEDQKALQLMKAQNWRRCPKCAVIVELTMGCNHITCRCKTEFCFKCGAVWDTAKGLCSRSCELWDEHMLLEQRERAREQAHLQLRRANPLLAPRVLEPPPPPYRPREQENPAPRIGLLAQAPLIDWDELLRAGADRGSNDLSWMEEPGNLSMRHWFTANMINSLQCQYCDAKLNSLSDLRYHLGHVRWHQVYACCGRFFKRDVDFERHREAKNWHHDTVERNGS